MDNKDIKLSFDFDGSLIRKELQEYAKELVGRGFEVWIVTRRYSNINDYTKEFCDQYGIANLIHDHKHLFTVAKNCRIELNHIHFMDMVYKYWFFKNNIGFLWHIDDDNIECNDINRESSTIAVSCAPGNTQWRNKCERLIKNKLDEKSI